MMLMRMIFSSRIVEISMEKSGLFSRFLWLTQIFHNVLRATRDTSTFFRCTRTQTHNSMPPCIDEWWHDDNNERNINIFYRLIKLMALRSNWTWIYQSCHFESIRWKRRKLRTIFVTSTKTVETRTISKIEQIFFYPKRSIKIER